MPPDHYALGEQIAGGIGPDVLTLRAPPSEENGTTTDLTLKDDDPKVAKNAQFYPVDAKQVSFVEIHIMSVYAPTGASPSSVAIAEVEFRVKD